MNLIAFALCSMPNVAAARRLYNVEGLDDAAVAKILFHRRKQQANSENLRPDQLRVALVSLVYGEPEQPVLRTLSVASEDEATVLRHLNEALGGTARLAGWRLSGEMEILRLRAAALAVSMPRLWQEEHIDLGNCWGSEAPLDEAARLMGLPGLKGSERVNVWDAWRAGDHDKVQVCAELRALNTWQLAHKLAVAQGRLTAAHAKSGMQALSKKLADSNSAHLREYAAALEG